MFCVLPPNPILSTLGDEDGCIAKPQTSKSAGFNVCLLCEPREYLKPHEHITHYVLNHQLPFCQVCSMVFTNENARMTHENKKHWPFRCLNCRLHYLRTDQLDQHIRSVHKRMRCELCTTTYSIAPNDEATFASHLLVKHECRTSNEVFVPSIVKPIMPSDDDGLMPIRKYHCNLCDQTQSASRMLGHFLSFHRVHLNRLLQMLQQFQETNRHLMSRFGVETKKAETRPIRPFYALTFDDIADNFEICERDGGISHIATKDFDTDRVQYVASSDDELEDYDVLPAAEDDGNAASAVVRKADASPKKTGRPYRCPYCETSTSFNRSTLGRHMSGVHGFRLHNMEYRCQRCRQKFVQLQSLRRHKLRQHVVDDKSLCCPLCAQSIGSKKELRQHIREHVDYHDYPQPPNTLAFGCRYCDAKFWTIDQKNAHQTAMHALTMPKEDVLMCGLCGITTSSKSYLLVHTAEAHASLTQLGAFIFKCTICTTVHKSLDAVREHMQQVHIADTNTEFCPVAECRVRLSTLLRLPAFAELQPDIILKLHLRDHHHDQYAYRCKLCNRTMSQKQHALRHFKSKHCADMKADQRRRDGPRIRY